MRVELRRMPILHYHSDRELIVPLCSLSALRYYNKKLSCCCDSRSYRVQIRSPHTSLHMHCSRHSSLGSLGTRIGGRTERHCADSRPYKRHYMCIGTQVAVRFFVVRFMAKRCVVEQKCQKGQIARNFDARNTLL